MGSIITTIALFMLMMFFAADVGFSLYLPNRLSSETPSCTLHAISGDVFVLKRNALSWVSVADSMELEPGSRIRTANDAQASLVFAQGTTTKLEPGTDIIVEKIEGNENTATSEVILKQQEGKTWNQVEAAEKRIEFLVRTRSADVKVHGTLFSTEVDDSGKTTVRTTRGLVSVSAEGQGVQVSSGEMTEVASGMAPSLPSPMPKARDELVFTFDNSAQALVTDPDGSSVGYLADGSKVNQISGSNVSAGDDSVRKINIYEPEEGAYLITIRGVADGAGRLDVEGFAGGESTFTLSESYNVTAANEVVLKLHYDVLKQLLPEMTVANLEQPETDEPDEPLEPGADIPVEEAGKDIVKAPEDEVQQKPEQGELSSEKPEWLRMSGSSVVTKIVPIAGIILIFGCLYIYLRKRS